MDLARSTDVEREPRPPSVRPSRGPAPTVRRLLAALFTGLAVAAFAWYRLGPVTRNTVWAEDGGVFMRDRVEYGPVASLLHPYAGYLHLVPRLIVDIGWALPIADYARVMSVAACVVVGVVSATVFLLARDVVPAWPLRVVLAAIPAVLPLAPYEIGGNVANLHWFLLFLAPWVLAYRSRTWWGAVGVAVVAALVVLTELQSLYFIPLLLLAWSPLRGRAGATSAGPDGGDGAPAAGVPARIGLRALPVTLVALAGGAAQVVAALTDDRISKPGEPAFADVVAGWLLQPVAGAWNPDVGAVLAAVVAHGWAAVLVPVAVLAFVVVAALLVGTWRARWMIVALAAVSGGVWWAALLANGGAAQPWSHPVASMVALQPERYAAAAGLLVVAVAVVAAGVLVESRGWSAAARRRTRPGGAVRVIGAAAGWCVVAAVVAAAVASAAPGTTRRSDGPVWAAQMPAAVAACHGDPDRVVEVRTAPWTARVPCTRLLER